MSHRRTHLWISLIVGVIVWGIYFAHFLRVGSGGDPRDLALWFIGALTMVVVAETMATGLIAWLFRRKARVLDDGPTLEAALKASHIALMLLIAMILIAAGILSLPALFGMTLIGMSQDMPIFAANALLAMVVIAELVRAAFTLALMPRS
ncbi:hypothetical protein GVN24_33300 [Rhizobium sp. CRIBSB]|nr:hypothetical protein [Rhizobium sp. CRIBSB]